MFEEALNKLEAAGEDENAVNALRNKWFNLGWARWVTNTGFCRKTYLKDLKNDLKYIDRRIKELSEVASIPNTTNQPQANSNTRGFNQPQVDPNTTEFNQPQVDPNITGFNQPQVDPNTTEFNQPQVDPNITGFNQPQVDPNITGFNQPQVDPNITGFNLLQADPNITGFNQPQVDPNITGFNQQQAYSNTTGFNQPQDYYSGGNSDVAVRVPGDMVAVEEGEQGLIDAGEENSEYSGAIFNKADQIKVIPFDPKFLDPEHQVPVFLNFGNVTLNGQQIPVKTFSFIQKDQDENKLGEFGIERYEGRESNSVNLPVKTFSFIQKDQDENKLGEFGIERYEGGESNSVNSEVLDSLRDGRALVNLGSAQLKDGTEAPVYVFAVIPETELENLRSKLLTFIANKVVRVEFPMLKDGRQMSVPQPLIKAEEVRIEPLVSDNGNNQNSCPVSVEIGGILYRGERIPINIISTIQLNSKTTDLQSVRRNNIENSQDEGASNEIRYIEDPEIRFNNENSLDVAGRDAFTNISDVYKGMLPGGGNNLIRR